MAHSSLLLRPEDLNRIVSVRDASTLTGIPDFTIREWLRNGRITRYGVKRCYRVLLSDLMPVTPPNPLYAYSRKPIRIADDYHARNARKAQLLEQPDNGARK